jgi:hypothetical protein
MGKKRKSNLEIINNEVINELGKVYNEHAGSNAEGSMQNDDLLKEANSEEMVASSSVLPKSSYDRFIRHRTSKPTNKMVMAMARAGHIPLFSTLDVGVYRCFEGAVVNLILLNRLTLPQLQELGPFLPFLRQDRRIPDEICRDAVLPDSSGYTSREDWLQRSEQMKTFRNSLEITRQKKLACVRETLFKAFVDEFGENRQSWIRAFSKHNLSVLALNSQVYKIWLGDSSGSLPNEQATHAVQITRTLYKGMRAYLRPSSDDRTPRDFISFEEENLDPGSILLRLPRKIQDLDRVRVLVSFNAEIFTNLVMHVIGNEAQITQAVQVSTLSESVTATPVNHPSIPSESKRKRSHLPAPFDATFSVSVLTSGYNYTSKEVKNMCSTFTDFQMHQVLLQRENEVYRKMIVDYSESIQAVGAVIAVSINERKRLAAKVLAASFVVPQDKPKSSFE